MSVSLDLNFNINILLEISLIISMYCNFFLFYIAIVLISFSVNL
jgi:hypothetical protein